MFYCCDAVIPSLLMEIAFTIWPDGSSKGECQKYFFFLFSSICVFATVTATPSIIQIWKVEGHDIRYGLPKKSCCSFGFCPNEGGVEGPAQIFCPLFTNYIYWVNLGMMGGGDPCPIFLAHWH